MESPEIKEGKCRVVEKLKASATKLGLPVPIVNWRTDYYRDSAVYTAFVFFGAKEKRLSFLTNDLCAINRNHPTAITVQIDKTLR